MKYLWLISQDTNDDYDTYDSAIVVAVTAEEAKLIHPRNGHTLGYDEPYGSWVSTPEQVKVERIGIAEDRLQEGAVICASFNAG